MPFKFFKAKQHRTFLLNWLDASRVTTVWVTSTSICNLLDKPYLKAKMYRLNRPENIGFLESDLWYSSLVFNKPIQLVLLGELRWVSGRLTKLANKSSKRRNARRPVFQHVPKPAWSPLIIGAPNDNFRENICSEDDLRSRIFGTFVVT